MKVICIDAGEIMLSDMNSRLTGAGLTERKEYTVIGEGICFWTGTPTYILAEFQPDKHGFLKQRFTPLSDEINSHELMKKYIVNC